MKRRINICSALKQGSTYEKSFFCQVKALTEKGYEIGVVVVVVDGETISSATLLAAQSDQRVCFVFEGPRGAPTCFMQERAVSWARACNMALEQSLKTPSEFTLWVESDLSFPCDLIELLMEPNQDVVAPIVMLGANFYDSWGFRDLAGKCITTLAELQALRRGPGPLTELSSVGSCLLLRSSLLDVGIRMPPRYENGLLVGFCQDARASGARVFCRQDVAIIHPTSLWAEQVYRVTACRYGDGHAWEELALTGGETVAGPYFDFVIPEAVRLLARNARKSNLQTRIAYSSNMRREIAILLGDNQDLPPAPEGFEIPTSPHSMLRRDTAYKNIPWWRKIFPR
jgi:hypothetical protein